MKIVKNIAIVILVLALMAGSIYEYFRLKKTEVPVSTAIAAIPIDASFVLECKQVYPFWKSVSQTSLIWQDLLGTETLGELNHNLAYLDSLLGTNVKVHTALEGNPFFISAHKNGMEHFDYLFICSLPDAAVQPNLLTFLASQGQVSQEEYEGTTVYTLKHGNNELTYAISINGIFICSFQLALVKESLRQLQSHISLLNNRYFTKVLNTTSGLSIAQLFINFQSMNKVVAPFMSQGIQFTLLSLPDFAQWMELDLSFTPNEIVMNGFTDCDTTGGQYLELFTHQQAREIKIASVVPSNTALMSCMELSDYSIFKKLYEKCEDQHRKLYKQKEWIDGVKKKYGLDPEKYFSWINNEMALVITEPTDSTLQNDVYAVLGTNSTREARNLLDSLSVDVARADSIGSDTAQFMQHEIRCVGIDYILPALLGGIFEPIKKSYFTTLDGYVVFANSIEALKMFISHYEGGNTLEKDQYYQSFIKDHVENESGIYVYNNMALSPMLYEQYLDKPYATAIKKHADICRKFQAVSMQMSYMQGMFYTSIYLKRNPLFKKQAGALWQVALDTGVATAPCWVTDFKTQNKYVMVEDKADYVYLISNTGKALWKRKLDGKILSCAIEVDALKNGKTQFLFNTTKSIYVLDRNGSNLPNFPVRLSSSATAPVTLLDFDGDRKYRMLVSCSDKVIREYGINGKQVDGWAKPETDGTVNCGAKYFTLDNKDYALIVDDQGRVYAFDRKGKARFSLHNHLPQNISAFYITMGSSLANTYLYAADTAGVVSRLSLDDHLTKTHYLAGPSVRPDFTSADLDGDGKTKMIFLSSNEVFAYDSNKALIFHCSGKDSLTNLQTFVFPENKLRIGAVDDKDNRLYLWDNHGAILSDFPLYGSLGFSISNMNNDGQLYLVAGSQDNNIYVYSLP
jgi:hypothetical protein